MQEAGVMAWSGAGEAAGRWATPIYGNTIDFDGTPIATVGRRRRRRLRIRASDNAL